MDLIEFKELTQCEKMLLYSSSADRLNKVFF